MDDRLLAEDLSHLPWLQQAFDATCKWDQSWHFNTRPKTIAFGFGQDFRAPVWPDGLPVSVGACPIYLGVPLPVPTFYRSHYFEPVLAECHYILDRVLHNRSCTTSVSRQYVVSSIIQKKLTYSSTVIRCTEKQYFALRSKIFQLVFDKALAAYDAAIALVLPCHLLDYKHAAIYTSLCSWERFFKSGGLPDFLKYWPPLYPHGRRASFSLCC